MRKFSKNKKLNNVLNIIYNELMEMGRDEILRYMKEFPYEKDYNIYQYGNVRIYNEDIRELYKDYKSLKNASMNKIIDIYKRQVRYCAVRVINTTRQPRKEVK